MPDVKISALPVAATLTGPELIPLVQAGVTVQATAAEVAALAAGVATPPGGANGQVQFNNGGAFGGLTAVQLTAAINDFSSIASGAVPASGGGTANFLRADGSWAVPALTPPGGTNGQVQVNVAGVFGGITAAQLTALIGNFTDTLKGAVLPSGGGTANFLRADGSWAAPAYPVSANPTALVGKTAANGVASTFMRSDAAPAINPVILDIPQNVQNADYQFALADRGEHVYHTDANPYNWTIPANATTAFPVGSAVTLVNDGTADVTIVAAGGVTIVEAGTGTTGDRTLPQFAMATILKVGTDRWYITGVGVT